MKRQAEILKNNEQQFRKLLLYPDELRRRLLFCYNLNNKKAS